MKGQWDRPTQTTLWAASIAVLLTAATATYLALSYSSLPRAVPVQYVRGVPVIYDLKSPTIVMLPALVQCGLLAIFASVVLLLLWRGQPVDAVTPQREADNMRMRIAAEGTALIGVVWTAMQALGALRLIGLWRGAWGDYGRAFSVALLIAIAASVVIIVRTMRLIGRQHRYSQPDNPSVWRLRHLYFNPGDPSLFVQTRTGAGWTLNFGRPVAIVLLAATLLVGVGGPFALVRYVLHGHAF